MEILVDTPIWSLAFRKKINSKEDDKLVAALKGIIADGQAKIIGPIRQEVLSGISSSSAFQALKGHLEAFEDIPIITPDYENAAELFNICRKKGIQGSQVDFLICAMSLRHNLIIFTPDHDFVHYAKCIPITLHKPY